MMLIRLVIQLLFIGLISGYNAYRKDNNIEPETEPYSILYWLLMWLAFPLAFMWVMFLESLEKRWRDNV